MTSNYKQEASAMKYPIYFGTYSNSLYKGEFDGNTGALKLTGSVEVNQPSYIVKDGNFLYGVSETDKFKNQNGGALFSVSIRDNEEMALTAVEATNGKHPCHLYAAGNHIYVANYSEGTLSIFNKEENGTIKPSHLSIAHYGKSINPQRQTQSHIHFVTRTPDRKHIAICDLGLDKVFLYPVDVVSGLSTEAIIIDCPPGSGPRHLTYTDNGKTLYVLTELGNTILVFQKNGNDIQPVQEISTLPPDFTGITTAAAIHISADNKYIAASNRGHDSIAVYRVKSDETLEGPEHIITGATPRDFNFSPCGKWILSASQADNKVTVYNMESKYKAVCTMDIPSPVCVVF